MCCKDTVSLQAKHSDSLQEICSTQGWCANAESQVTDRCCIMILAKTGSVFAIAGRRHDWDTGYSTPPHLIAEDRGKGLFQTEGIPSS